jgi:hypothetical protein
MDAVARREENGESIGCIGANFQSARHHFVPTRATMSRLTLLAQGLAFNAIATLTRVGEELRGAALVRQFHFDLAQYGSNLIYFDLRRRVIHAAIPGPEIDVAAPPFKRNHTVDVTVL